MALSHPLPLLFENTDMELKQTHQQLHSSSGSLDTHALLIQALHLALVPLPFEKKAARIIDHLISQKELLLGPRAALFLVDESTERLELLVSRGISDISKISCTHTTFGSCHCGIVARRGKARFFQEPPPLMEAAGKANAYSGNYCFPVIKDGQPLGVLSIYVQPGHNPTPELRNLLDAVAGILAGIIEARQMEQQLVHLVNDLRGTILSLKEERNFSESIIQGLTHGLLVTDLEGKISKSNSAAVRLLKPVGDTLEGKTLTSIFGHEGAKRLMGSKPGGKSSPERELRFRNPGGEESIVGFSNVMRINSRGEQVGVIILITDISEITYVRNEMEKMNRLSTVAEIASAVAHEVRNPLAGIKIMAQSIEEESNENSEQQECSQRIIRQVDRLNQLLSDFFSYARPAEPQRKPTSIGEILSETKPLINNRLQKNRIEVHQRIDPRLPKIMADPHQVQQVFLNLFLNSIDAINQQGTIDISASFISKQHLQTYRDEYQTVLEDHDYVMVYFSDNGSGMAEDVAEQVFEPFFTTKSSGAGLGLSIVYRTLKENGATIVLKSRQGQGAVFTIFFQADT